MRAVLDPNVIISALLSPAPSPAKLLRAWQQGEFELIVSPTLLGELETALAYPKLRKRITSEEARPLVEWLGAGAVTAGDPGEQPP
ncbi:MAG TPA: putative toxin-antitoxin system toxin component, PIN family, partial [Actinomycetota bacterium]|nr:putative toxin-antitoxin system toxin component, PIN family [Actinomycetota bacterium]